MHVIYGSSYIAHTMAEVWNVAMTTETTLLDSLLILLHSSTPTSLRN